MFKLTMIFEKKIAKILNKNRVMVNFEESKLIPCGESSFVMMKADGIWFDCSRDGEVNFS